MKKKFSALLKAIGKIEKRGELLRIVFNSVNHPTAVEENTRLAILAMLALAED
jgi:hypothetical protein